MSQPQPSPFRSDVFRPAALEAYVQTMPEPSEFVEPRLELAWIWVLVMVLVMALGAVWGLGLIG